LRRAPATGGKSTPLRIAAGWNPRIDEPDWSRDGTRIAAILGSSGIVTMNSQGKKLMRITRGDDAGPTWSPSGRTILFTHRTDGARNVSVVGADGKGLRALTSDGVSQAMDWSPDGKKILFLRPGENRVKPNKAGTDLGHGLERRQANTPSLQPHRMGRALGRLGQVASLLVPLARLQLPLLEPQVAASSESSPRTSSTNARGSAPIVTKKRGPRIPRSEPYVLLREGPYSAWGRGAWLARHQRGHGSTTSAVGSRFRRATGLPDKHPEVSPARGTSKTFRGIRPKSL
jgi:WD40-like Beta Propeller Repeat